MGLSITFSGDVKKFERFLTPSKHTQVLEAEIGKATIKNAALLRDRIEQSIKRKKFRKNSKLTLALKDGDTPLMDETNLIQSIEVEIKSSFGAFVGFMKSQKTTRGADMKKTIERLEKGFTVKITPKMRAFLFARARERGNPVPANTGPSKGVMVIPPRPFLTRTFQNKRLQRRLIRNWENALKRVYKKLGAL